MWRGNHLLALISVGLIGFFSLLLIIEKAVVELRNWLHDPAERVAPPPHLGPGPRASTPPASTARQR